VTSKADRPYRSFPRGQGDEAGEPDATPPLRRPLRERVRAWLSRLLPVGLGAALAVVAGLVGLSPFGAAPLTGRDVDEAIARALASATPRPPIAIAVFERVRPSVVEVRTRASGSDAVRSAGSGVILDENATILTSFHIVQDAEAISVRFADGTESAATILGSAPENDIAVLRPTVPPPFALPATLGSARSLQIGEDAIVVGHPFGLTGSLSVGVVSGLGRTFQSPTRGAPLDDLIQFDAAVNPGSSGGPLLNRDGDVVGIVTGLVNPTGANLFAGVGFAVPIETAASAVGVPPE